MDIISTDSSLLLYQTEDGQTKIEVRLQDETVWLNQAELCELFDKDKRTISEHIQNIFKEGELIEEAVIRKFRTTASDGKNYQVSYYNLDVIISVGYRVSSHRGTQFRIWATNRLKEYLIKGFTLDDERLKRGGGGNYFNELLSRIRDIRSSEKVFWRKVLDIYATSIDYDPKTEDSKLFFSFIQNKMHWAAHGHTAAEIIYSRADAEKTNMGLTSWSGKKLRKTDVEIAKNYLNEEELKVLNLIVSLYLDFAELQALSRNPMYMKDWISKLDDFLRMASRDILSHDALLPPIACVTLPVTIDLEGGYGRTSSEVQITIKKVIEAGAVGINFEDQVFGSEELFSITDQCKRIKAVREAAEETSIPVFINARTDIFFKFNSHIHNEKHLDEAYARASAYADSGANGFFVPGLRDAKLIEKLCKRSPLPINIMVLEDTPSPKKLAELGVARISYGPGPYCFVMEALKGEGRRAF